MWIPILGGEIQPMAEKRGNDFCINVGRPTTNNNVTYVRY